MNEECIEAMFRVANVTDVFDIHMANLLLFVEINFPEYIVIGRPMCNYPGRQPIFGAMLTTEGKDFLNKCLNKN